MAAHPPSKKGRGEDEAQDNQHPMDEISAAVDEDGCEYQGKREELEHQAQQKVGTKDAPHVNHHLRPGPEARLWSAR